MKISVNYDVLKTISEDFNDIYMEASLTLDNIKSITNDLSNKWIGIDKDCYINSLNNLIKRIENNNNNILNWSNYLDKSSKKYQDIVSNNKDIIEKYNNVTITGNK